MKFNFFLKTLIIGVVIIFTASCDKDINEIGAGIVGDEHYGLNVQHFDVLAYNQDLGPVQTNDLPINQLGYYNNPVFGKTKASLFTQVNLATVNPTFYSPTIDSVYLYVPYYSTLVETNSDTGNSTYTLDSIHGNGKINLGVYESDYDITYDASSGLQQLSKYYSNQKPDFDAKIANGGVKLNNDNKNIFDHTAPDDNSQNSQFVFSEKQILFYKKDASGNAGYTEVASRKAPGMLLNLDTSFFVNKIFNAPTGKLYNNSTFNTYFKGLYFKVDEAAGSAAQGTLAMMNFSRGVVTIVYKDKTSLTDATVIRKELNINLNGHTVNLLENDNNYPGYVPPDHTAGDANLYLKGGNGSMAVIDLFNGDKNDNSTALNDMRDKKWLINEANLTFYIDKSKIGASAPEPNRIYLYDLTHNRPLVDLYTDYTTSINSKYNKFIHGGILLDENSVSVKQDAGGRGTKYKIKITNYIRNLFKYGGSAVDKDSTNVRLGLVVTENILNAGLNYLKTPFTTSSSSTAGSTFATKYFPVMSVVNPLGTILYGSNPSVPDDKRLKLEIYYTKPD